MHRGELELTRIIGIAATLCDRYQHVAAVPDSLQSSQDVLSPTAMRAIQVYGDGEIERIFEKKRKEYSVFYAKLELKPRRVREKTVSLEATVNEYKGLV